MIPELLPAIEGLYVAFRSDGPAPLPEGCPCCTTAGEFLHLVSKPLRHLSADELDRYARKAMTTVGHTETFRYFLPRIVQLAVDDKFLVDREIVFGKLHYGNWESWPAVEREAINNLVSAVTATFATRPYDPHELDAWLCCLGSFVRDLPRALEPLMGSTTAARANLQATVALNTGSWGATELRNAFWEDSPNRDVFIYWLDEARRAQAAG